jgi:hypothetical protein
MNVFHKEETELVGNVINNLPKPVSVTLTQRGHIAVGKSRFLEDFF